MSRSPAAALAASLLAAAALAGEPAPAPAADAPAPQAGAAVAPPYTVADLFKPLQYRSYHLSPNGEFLLERYQTFPENLPASVNIHDPAHQRLLRQSDEEIVLTNLKTNQFQVLSHTTRGYRTSGVIWIDDRNFVWNMAAGFGNRVEHYAERVSLTVAEDGAFSVKEVKKLHEFGNVIDPAPNDRKRVLFMDADEQGLRIHSIDPLQELEPQLVAANRVLEGINDVDDVALDGAGVVRAFEAVRRGTLKRIYYRDARDAPWRLIHQFEVTGDVHASLEGFDADGRNLLVITSEGTDQAVLRQLDPATGKLGRILFQDPRNDVLSPVRHPGTGQLLGVVVDDAAARMEGIDPRIKAMHDRVRAQIPKYTPRIIDVDDPLSRAVIFTAEPDNPGKYSLYDVANDRILLMAHAAPWLKGRKLSRTRELTVTARDGLRITAYYTPPLVQRFARQPMVLMPHGGPIWVRERLVFDPEVQLLASHGYAVLQVDFRGSGGYGVEFLKRGYRQWGREMQLDLVDALEHALAQGWADRERVCIYGASYGGYAAMMGLVQTPDLFRCGVTLAGVSDLSLLFKSDEARNLPGVKDLITKVVGDPVKERETLNQSSPAFLARGIKRPVFIAHGGKDPRAVPEHAYRLRAAIESGGGTVEWMFLPEAGHGFSKLADQEQFYAKLLAFLDQHLGPP